MDTTFELIRVMRGAAKGNKDDFRKLFRVIADDMYFQVVLVVCDPVETDRVMKDLFSYIYRNALLIENPENAAEWINTVITQRTTSWLKVNRAAMIAADKKELYPVPTGPDAYLPGNEIEDEDFNRIMIEAVCNMPEVIRQTALAFYFDDLPMEVIIDSTDVDKSLIKRRCQFVERTCSFKVQDFCKANRLGMREVNSQRVRQVLKEMAGYYKYPSTEEVIVQVLS